MLIKTMSPEKERRGPCSLQGANGFLKQALVAEDNLDFIFLVNTEVEKISDWKFHFVQYGMDALYCCKNFLFDAVILDVSLPDCSGFYVAKELKRMNYKGPILAFTLVDPQSFYSKKESFYFDGVLKKPFDKENFSDLTHRVYDSQIRSVTVHS